MRLLFAVCDAALVAPERLIQQLVEITTSVRSGSCLSCLRVFNALQDCLRRLLLMRIIFLYILICNSLSAHILERWPFTNDCLTKFIKIIIHGLYHIVCSAFNLMLFALSGRLQSRWQSRANALLFTEWRRLKLLVDFPNDRFFIFHLKYLHYLFHVQLADTGVSQIQLSQRQFSQLLLLFDHIESVCWELVPQTHIPRKVQWLNGTV